MKRKFIYLAAILLIGGCLAPVTVNVFSSRMAIDQGGTNTIHQTIDGGANVSSNSPALSTPLF